MDLERLVICHDNILRSNLEMNSFTVKTSPGSFTIRHGMSTTIKAAVIILTEGRQHLATAHVQLLEERLSHKPWTRWVPQRV